MKTKERIEIRNHGEGVVLIIATPGMAGVIGAAMKRWAIEHGDKPPAYGGAEAKEFVKEFDRWTRS